jgi:Beta-propeller repeat
MLPSRGDYAASGEMMTPKRALRLGVCGAVLGAAYLGLIASAMAWDQPLWVRQFGTAEWDNALGVATDAAGNVYLTGDTGGSLGGLPPAIG